MLCRKPKILVIGAGLTGALITSQISRNPRLQNAYEVASWEKNGESGGRFGTFHSSDKKLSVDLGAQYLTQTKGNETSATYFQDLEGAGLLRPLNPAEISGFRNDETKLHYACRDGTGSIVRYFFNKATCEQKFEIEAISVSVVEDNGTSRFNVRSSPSSSETFDIVISTIPVPELLQLENIRDLISNSGESSTSENGRQLIENMENVKYNSRYAMSLLFESPLNLPPSQKQITFVRDSSSLIRYWAIEHSKRTGDSVSGKVSPIVIHTSAETQDSLSRSQNSEDMRKVELDLLDGIRKHIPELGTEEPNIILKRWKYSQVTRPYIGTPGFSILSRKPLFIATGDGFSGSGFEGCIFAAKKTVDHLLSVVD